MNPERKRKLLLSGSSGFIGKHLVRHLSNAYEITPFDLALGHDMRDYSLVRRMVEGHDALLHFGAVAVGRRNVEKRPDAASIEYAGTETFARVSRETNTPLLYASSIRVYGSLEEMAGPEKGELHPTDLYGKIKIDCEKIIRDIAGPDTRFAILRIAAVYGPGMPHDFVVSQIFSASFEQRPFILFHQGTKKRNFIYVEDVASAVEAVLRWNFLSNETFNIAVEDLVSLTDLARMIADVTSKSFEVRVGESLDPGIEEHIPIEKAKSFLGWSPQINLRDGLQKTYEQL